MVYELSPYGSQLFPSLRVLHDRGIREAIERGDLQIGAELGEDQLQPGSLEGTVGKVKVYDAFAVEKTAAQVRHDTHAAIVRAGDSLERVLVNISEVEPSDEFAEVYPDEKGLPIVIPPKAFVELYFHESLQFDPEKYKIDADLRSSRGRPAFRMNSRQIEENCEGRFISFWNFNPNPLRIYGQSKFAHIFFYPNAQMPADGRLVTDPERVEELAKEVCQGPYQTLGPYLCFQAGDHILQFKENRGVIDTNEKYSDDYLYETHYLGKPFRLRPWAATIAQLHPRLRLPPNIGIHILHNLPYLQRSGLTGPDLGTVALENYSVNAGWVDPGYEGFVTAHPLVRHNPLIIQKGRLLALGIFVEYDTPVERPYGSSALKSHYQNSKGTGFKS